MKALVIASVLFFSLRAMSEVGEDKKSQCIYGDQTSRKTDLKVTLEVKSPIENQDGQATSGK